MGLREDALAAAEAARENRIDTARTALGTALAPTDVSALDVVDETDDLVVFCGDNVCLAVRDPGTTGDRVTLVVDDDGWTYIGVVKTLADLGVLLARLGA